MFKYLLLSLSQSVIPNGIVIGVILFVSLFLALLFHSLVVKVKISQVRGNENFAPNLACIVLVVTNTLLKFQLRISF